MASPAPVLPMPAKPEAGTWRAGASAPALPKRDLFGSIWRGFLGRCPHCGEGKLFWRFLKVVDACPVCGEAFHHHRADDAPPYITIVLVGHLVVPTVLAV